MRLAAFGCAPVLERRSAAEVGRRLVRSGALRTATQVAYLTVHERLRAAQEPSELWSRVAEERRARVEQFVELDTPFQPDERRDRIQNLMAMMDRADVTVTEKFRRLLEAYQIENGYGASIDSYRGEVDFGGQTRIVDFLSLGRVALLYQTLDGETSGVWDSDAGSFQHLESSYNAPLRRGIRIALKQESPQLLQLPIQAPEDVR